MGIFDDIDFEVSIKLRDYQEEAKKAYIAGMESYRRQLVVMATGLGKTILFSSISHESRGKSLILANRDELVFQAREKLFMTTGQRAAIEKAQRRASLDAEYVIASINTICRSKERFAKDHFKQIIVDEAHGSLGSMFQQTLQYFESAHVLGVTATPDRGDKRNLGEYYEHVAYEMDLRKATKEMGWLVPIHVQAAPIEIDISSVETKGNDLDKDQLDKTITPYLRKAAAILFELKRKRTLVFLPLRRTSKEFVSICKEMGIRAMHIDGETRNRREVLDAFRSGEFDVLCNAQLLGVGYDEPSVDTILDLRPTKSRSWFAQMVGRGTRTNPSNLVDAYPSDPIARKNAISSSIKPNLLLIEPLFTHEKLSLIHPASLICKDKQTSESVKKELKKAGGKPIDLFDAEENVSRDREEALRKKILENQKKKSKLVDAVEFCLELGNLDLAEYEPMFPWESQPITDKQREMLLANDLDVEAIKNRGHATKIIDVLMRRRELNLSTPKQIKFLRKHGYKNPEHMDMHSASRIIGGIIDRNRR